MSKWSPNFPAYEEFGTRREHVSYYEPLSSRISVTVRVPRSDVLNFMDDMMKNSRQFPDNTLLPYVCRSCEVGPTQEQYATDGDEQVIQYPELLVIINYEVFNEEGDLGYGTPSGGAGDGPDYEVEVVDRIEPAFQYITINKNRLVYDLPAPHDTPIEDAQEPARLERRFVFTREIRAVDLNIGIPFSWLNLIGYVNDSILESKILKVLFQEETLLYEGFTTSYGRKTSRQDNQVANITTRDFTMRFLWKQIENSNVPAGVGGVEMWAGHNHFYDPVLNIYARIASVRPDTGSLTPIQPYQTEDLSGLIFPTQPTPTP